MAYNLDHFVIFGTLVRCQVVSKALRILGNFRSLRGVEIVNHTAVEGEERGRGTNFGTHVADRGHTRARERLDTGTVIFDDGTSSTLDGENTSDLEDNVYRI